MFQNFDVCEPPKRMRKPSRSAASIGMCDQFGVWNNNNSARKMAVGNSTPGRPNNEKQNQDCWKFLSVGERVLLFLLIFVSTAVLILFILIISMLIKGRNTCNSFSCIHTASKIMESLDQKFNPCEDFASFVCNEQTEACWQPENKKDQIIRKFLEQDEPNDNSLLGLSREFFKACTNSSAMEEDGVGTLVDLLDSIGGWPLILGQKWNESEFHWLKSTAQLRGLGLESDWFVQFGRYEDENGEKFLKISPPSRLNPISKIIEETYLETMVDVAAEFESSRIIAAKEQKKVADLEYSLAMIAEEVKNQHKDEDDFNVKFIVEELNTFWPEISLVEVLNNLSQGYAIFTARTVVVVESQNYVDHLNGLLMKTSKRTQANFLVWKVIEALLPFSSERLRTKSSDYMDVGSLEDYCFKETIKRFYGVIQAEYVKRVVSEELHGELTQMTNLIREQILDTTGNTVVQIGDSGDQNYLIESNFVFNSTNVIYMANQLLYEEQNQFYRCLHKSTDDCSNPSDSDLNNRQIIFDNTTNTLHLPVELLDTFWYNPRQPNYLNYAALGTIVAESIKTAVQNISSGFQDHSNQTYLAYLNWVDHHGLEARLPGLNYTNNQLFWIQTGIVYCQHYNASLTGDLMLSSYFVRDFLC